MNFKLLGLSENYLVSLKFRNYVVLNHEICCQIEAEVDFDRNQSFIYKLFAVFLFLSKLLERVNEFKNETFALNGKYGS